MSIRPINQIFYAKPTREGAGVNLHRVFGFDNTALFDPFLMMDDFSSNNPDDFKRGFPWHPHRGIETITYILKGKVEHADSLGNKGLLFDGDIQWMTAGSGIIHQEMPKEDENGSMHGFQLWANLPSSKKMTPPRYQDVKSKEILSLSDDDFGTIIKVIAGNYKGKKGVIDGIAANPQFLDIYIPPLKTKVFPLEINRQGFAYIFEGEGDFSNSSKPFGIKIEKEYKEKEITLFDMTGKRTLVLFDKGNEVKVKSGENGVRFLFVSGEPIKEPVAWHGPIVMNTLEELKQAYKDLKNGSFIKNK